MEGRSFIGELESILIGLVALAESDEIACGARGYRGKELEDEFPFWLSIDSDVEEGSAIVLSHGG